MSGGQELALILAAALAIDFTLGEPKGALHPVVWAGKAVSLVARLSRNRSSAAQFLIGGAGVGLIMALSAWLAWVAAVFLPGQLGSALEIPAAGDWATVAVSAFLLKLTIAPAGLIRAAAKVGLYLKGGNIEGARLSLSELVSRPADSLTSEQTAAAAVESVGENFTDAVVAPVFFFIIFGVAGAWAYRVLNTADSMIGYRGEHEFTGKVAARLDDVANYIPARLAGMILCVAAAVTRLNWRLAVKIMLRDCSRTESPNAGWTMSATAGALGVRLEKVGHYVLGPELGRASHASIGQANALMLTATVLSSLMVIGLSFGMSWRLS